MDRAAQQHGLIVPAGTVSHTGVAGLTLGGGTGRLARKLGLSVDSLFSANVSRPTANRCAPAPRRMRISSGRCVVVAATSAWSLLSNSGSCHSGWWRATVPASLERRSMASLGRRRLSGVRARTYALLSQGSCSRLPASVPAPAPRDRHSSRRPFPPGHPHRRGWLSRRDGSASHGGARPDTRARYGLAYLNWTGFAPRIAAFRAKKGRRLPRVGCLGAGLASHSAIRSPSASSRHTCAAGW